MYGWRLVAGEAAAAVEDYRKLKEVGIDRAMEAGIDDVGLGALCQTGISRSSWRS